MSKRINMYKAYGIIVLVLASFGVLSVLVSLLQLSNSFMGGLLRLSGNDDTLTLIIIAGIVLAAVIFYLGYMEFTSAFAFSKVLSHVADGSSSSMQKPGFVLSPKVYRISANIILAVSTLLTFLFFIYSIVMSGGNATMPIVAFIIMTVSALFCYINVYVRHTYLSDLLEREVLGTEGTGNSGHISLDSLNGLLSGYGIFSLVVYILLALATLFTVINIGYYLDTLMMIFGILMSAFFVFSAIVSFDQFNDIQKVVKHTR